MFPGKENKLFSKWAAFVEAAFEIYGKSIKDKKGLEEFNTLKKGLSSEGTLNNLII